jgi:hypothetical protein
MVSFLKGAMSLASNFLCCLIQGPEADESMAPCRSGSFNHPQPRVISIEEYKIMRVSNHVLTTRQNEVCVLGEEGQNVILSRHVTYKMGENGGEIACMKFEKYMILKGDLEDWKKRKSEQSNASLKKSVQVTIEEDIENDRSYAQPQIVRRL